MSQISQDWCVLLHFCFYFIFVILRIELRALCTLGEHITHWAISPAWDSLSNLFWLWFSYCFSKWEQSHWAHFNSVTIDSVISYRLWEPITCLGMEAFFCIVLRTLCPKYLNRAWSHSQPLFGCSCFLWHRVLCCRLALSPSVLS